MVKSRVARSCFSNYDHEVVLPINYVNQNAGNSGIKDLTQGHIRFLAIRTHTHILSKRAHIRSYAIHNQLNVNYIVQNIQNCTRHI